MIRKHRQLEVPRMLIATGTAVQEVWRKAPAATSLTVDVDGMARLSHINFPRENGTGLATLFIQGMLDPGFRASPAFYPSYAHQAENTEVYLTAVQEGSAEIATAVKAGDISVRLRRPVKHSGFQRLA